MGTSMRHKWEFQSSYHCMTGRPTREYRCRAGQEFCTLKDEEILNLEAECDGENAAYYKVVFPDKILN